MSEKQFLERGLSKDSPGGHLGKRDVTLPMQRKNLQAKIFGEIESEEVYVIPLAMPQGSTHYIVIPSNSKLDVNFAAAILNVHPQIFYQKIKDGELPFDSSNFQGLVDASAFVKFKREWDEKAAGALERVADSDADVNYIESISE